MDNISAVQGTHPPLEYDRNVCYRDQEAKESAGLARGHTKFANARETVLHDIDVSLRAILDMKTRLNTLTAIGRLPEELLAEILITFVQEHYHPTHRDYPVYSNHPPPQWIKLTHVCRHWRNIALDTVRLWSHIYLTRADALAEFLTRSKAAPLHIDLRYNHSNTSRNISSLDLIPPVSLRIRSLSVDAEILRVQAFCKQLTRPLEHLEKLALSSPLPHFGFYGPPPAVPFFQTEGLTPRLSHLELVRLPFRWTDPIFRSSLTTLKVTSPQRNPRHRDRPDVGTTTELLDILERIAPRLEVLHLNGALPTPNSQDLGPPPPPRSLSFPSLRSLRLCGPTYDCANLFSQFSSMDQIASLHLRGSSGSRGMKDLIRSLSNHLSTRPLVAVCFGSSCRSFDIDILGWQTTDVSSDAPIRLMFCGLHGAGEEDAMPMFVRESPPLFSRLEYLKLVNGISYKLKWRDLFSLTPQVRTLAFHGHPFDLFDALLDIRVLPSGQRLVPLPELRAVYFNDILFRYPGDDMDQEFIDDMITWVTLRSQHEMPIETLELRDCQHSEKKDMQALRRIVPNVVVG
ncbi:hypothetical protein LXA43DRAFT_1000840 [Ganoderma leucocontextum]|nr:hypothetical protein LXA43DRAFT_1000840 [Ganoderma leucocontextum]